MVNWEKWELSLCYVSRQTGNGEKQLYQVSIKILNWGNSVVYVNLV